MTISTYQVRLFGGRNLGVSYDSAAGTLTVMNQAINLSSLSAALQAQWANAVATNSSTHPAFGGDNVSQAVGAIMDAMPAWRSAVQAAVASYVASIAPFGDPETFSHT